MNFTKGEGVDVLFDCVAGVNSSFHLSLLNIDAKWILYGLLGGIKDNYDHLMQ